MTSPWQCTPTLTPRQRLDVLNLCNHTEVHLGREAIDEGRRRAVVHGWTAEHWLAYQDDKLVNYAMVTGTEHPSIEMCGGGLDRGLLEELLARRSSIDWWTRGTQPVDGGETVRTLQLLRVRLPVTVRDVPTSATMRNFDPHHDEEAWLDQNNTAFADHPEQGAWLLSDLDQRTHEPWFDPSGFLLLEIDGRLAASCWTKVHELHPDRFGEIYVVSVHPDFQGRDLGRVMVTQGLASLRRKGVASAVLFVDESNVAARSLYQSLGFELEREDHLIRFSRP
ncbi:MAG TPA: mycothiol synthase [Acidimicrobiales bacterium]|nr:mycothiol synthase [Acidimicrobiales bacterium]